MNRAVKSIRAAARRALTLAELLVVVAILVIVVLIAIPAFSAMLYSSEATLSESLLASGVKSARDAAIRGTANQDAAAVFVFEPNGRITIVPCIKVGEVWDEDLSPNNDDPILRDLFVPVGLISPAQLPRGWTVRGYAPPFMLQNGWYRDASGPAGGAHYPLNTGNWVFPETGFYFDRTANPPPNIGNIDGRNRQTFMIRFEAGTGRVVTSQRHAALVFDPHPSSQGRTALPWRLSDGTTAYPPPADPRQFVQRFLIDQGLSDDPGNLNYRYRVFGYGSADTVLARPVSALALTDERRLAAGMSPPVRPHPDTGAVYRPFDPNDNRPRFVGNIDGEDIRDWIEGDGSEARIYTLDRVTGELREVEAPL